ncbi:hypothetical protein ACC754_38590, partial [Rhizobium johnstonii]
TSSGMAEFSLVWNTASLHIESETGKVLATYNGAKAPDRLIHQLTGLDDICRTGVDREGPETQQIGAYSHVGEIADDLDGHQLNGRDSQFVVH